MDKVENVLFFMHLCLSCKNTKIIGDECIGCKSKKIIDSKIDMNIELVDQINQLQAQLEEAESEIKGAKKYLESCGYHSLDPMDGEPEYQMWQSFQTYLEKYSKEMLDE